MLKDASIQQIRSSGVFSTQPSQATLPLKPSVNMKFEFFLQKEFAKKQPEEDLRDRIVKYVQLIETNYSEAI